MGREQMLSDSAEYYGTMWVMGRWHRGRLSDLFSKRYRTTTWRRLSDLFVIGNKMVIGQLSYETLGSAR